MVKNSKSLKSDKLRQISSKSDISGRLSGLLREARRSRDLTQDAVARRLGLRQRQISDLERAKVDPRLSTVQDVARALDLELMLIPRHLISGVESLLRAGSAAAKQPMYALGDDDVEYREIDQPRVEVGANDEHHRPTARQRRRRKTAQ